MEAPAASGEEGLGRVIIQCPWPLPSGAGHCQVRAPTHSVLERTVGAPGGNARPSAIV